jgi:hypothetical protein
MYLEELNRRQQSLLECMSLPPIQSPAYAALISSQHAAQSLTSVTDADHSFSPFIDPAPANSKGQSAALGWIEHVKLWRRIAKCARRMSRFGKEFREIEQREKQKDLWEFKGAKRVNRVVQQQKNENLVEGISSTVFPICTLVEEGCHKALEQIKYLVFLKDSMGQSLASNKEMIKQKKAVKGTFADLNRDPEFLEIEKEIPEFMLELAKINEKHDLDLFDPLYFKPYLRKELREKVIQQVNNSSNLAAKLLRVGDILHVPFSQQEFNVVLDFVKSSTNVFHNFNEMIVKFVCF